MIRFGVIGTNWITEELIHAASEIEDFSLTAVYSRTETKAKEFAARFNAPHVYTDLDTMANSSEVDAVYIASPNSLHAEQAITCMKHGKHVLCEKPIASNAREVQEMFRVARENNVLLMEAVKSTITPNFRAIQANLHKIGKLRRFTSSFCQYSSRYDAYQAGTILNAFNPAFSSGSLMDIGMYCVYPMVVLFGRPSGIQASGLLLESGVDGQGSMLVKYEDKDAVLMHSKITNSNLPSEIQGELGTIVIDKISSPNKVEIRYKDGTLEDLTQPQVPRTMVYEVREFIELITKGEVESPTNSYRNSLIVMEILDEARKQMGVVFPADKRSGE
ncbi:Gfo/Idh/MocA family protein [Brevibacillus sp. SYSU BS000544]|uniref:Gfo/Idh/MocA family protein n=1 Tax=Brevibacillus sp. SYSU BS000544 TaxID=3416443 RepID=UPI003CE4BC17